MNAVIIKNNEHNTIRQMLWSFYKACEYNGYAKKFNT